MQCKDFVSYATEIKNAGWATSIKYTQNIINKVLSLNLQRFDNMVSVGSYVIGNTYTTQQDLNVRREPSGDKVPYEELTDNAKEHAFIGTSGEGILKRGTKVTIKEIQSTGSCTWLRIPSGWICAKNSKYTYVL